MYPCSWVPLTAIFGCSASTKLAAVLYAYRISGRRFERLSVRNFWTSKSLCGEATLKNVVIMTNIWEQVTPGLSTVREEELEHDFFRAAIDKGTRLCRHYGTPESVRAVLREVPKNQPVVLKIQSDLADEGRDIGQMMVGGLKKGIRDMVKRYENETRVLEEEMREAEKKRKMQDVIEKFWKDKSAEMVVRPKEVQCSTAHPESQRIPKTSSSCDNPRQE